MKINTKKVVPIAIILMVLISVGVGIVVYQYSQTKTDQTTTTTTTGTEPTIETIPSDKTQFSALDEVTKTMTSDYRKVKMKEILLNSNVTSFTVKWEIKGSKTFEYTEIGDTIQFADNSEELTAENKFIKMKEIAIDENIENARFSFKMAVMGESVAVVKVNGEKVGKEFKLSRSGYKSFTQEFQEINLKSGDKVQLYVRAISQFTPLIGSTPSCASVKDFQIRYDIVENVAESDVNYQIKINGVPETSWNVINSKDYTSVTEDIFTEGISENSTIELWVMTARGIEVSVRNMEICYNVK